MGSFTFLFTLTWAFPLFQLCYAAESEQRSRRCRSFCSSYHSVCHHGHGQSEIDAQLETTTCHFSSCTEFFGFFRSVCSFRLFSSTLLCSTLFSFPLLFGHVWVAKKMVTLPTSFHVFFDRNWWCAVWCQIKTTTLMTSFVSVDEPKGERILNVNSFYILYLFHEETSLRAYSNNKRKTIKERQRQNGKLQYFSIDYSNRLLTVISPLWKGRKR